MSGGRSPVPGEQVLELYSRGMTPHQIAAALGRSRSAIYTWLARNGIHKPYTAPPRCISAAIRKAKENPVEGLDWKHKKGQIDPWILFWLEQIPKPLPSTYTIARKAGYASSTVRMWFAGTRHPSEEALRDLIQTLRFFAMRGSNAS